jgi:ATP/maltotriose-dependent transcriptional regulator MalT
MGCANKDIGRHLEISLSTVKSHLSTLYRKLGVDSRTQALAHAYSLGVLDAGCMRRQRGTVAV